MDGVRTNEINMYFQGGAALIINRDRPIVSSGQDCQARKWNIFRCAEKHTPKNIQVRKKVMGVLFQHCNTISKL